jgi:hypothetical protein
MLCCNFACLAALLSHGRDDVLSLIAQACLRREASSFQDTYLLHSHIQKHDMCTDVLDLLVGFYDLSEACCCNYQQQASTRLYYEPTSRPRSVKQMRSGPYDR